MPQFKYQAEKKGKTFVKREPAQCDIYQKRKF